MGNRGGCMMRLVFLHLLEYGATLFVIFRQLFEVLFQVLYYLLFSLINKAQAPLISNCTGCGTNCKGTPLPEWSQQAFMRTHLCDA